MRELFVNPVRAALSTTSRDYLRFRGRSPFVQVAMHDEIERLGTEQLLRSRGAKILDFDASGSESELTPLNPKANVIVTSNRSEIGRGSEQFDLVGVAASSVPTSRILVICPAHFGSRAQMALDRVPNDGEILIRTIKEDTEALLEATRRLVFGVSNSGDPRSVLADNERILAATNAINCLSLREHELLDLVAIGFSNGQIAAHLKLSLRTVNNHIGKVFLKLGVNRDPSTNARVTAVLAYCVYYGILNNFTVAVVRNDQMTTDNTARAALPSGSVRTQRLPRDQVELNIA